jgi:hypothetical protein
MMRRTWIVLVIGALLLVLAVGVAGYVVWVGGEILAGFAAKTLCSCVFVSRREVEPCLDDDVRPYRYLVQAWIDRSRPGANARAFLIRRARADFREGLGCTLQ